MLNYFCRQFIIFGGGAEDKCKTTLCVVQRVTHDRLFCLLLVVSLLCAEEVCVCVTIPSIFYAPN